jgi:NSS family neurotransmitter:Na+ symporter
MAVGTGNIWRFPVEASSNGGGAFLIAVSVALFLWAIPLLMCEFFMGTRSRLGNIGTFRDFMGEKYSWAGAFMALVTIGIMFYYAVICGWCVRYMIMAFTGGLTPPAGGVEGSWGQTQWDAFINDPLQTVGYHGLAVVFTTAVVYRGIKGGLEKVLNVLLPALLVALLILFVRVVTLDGAGEGLRFLYVPEWGMLLESEVWLAAFTQAAWSTGAGWGLMMVYAVYAREGEDVAVNSGIIGFSDTIVGILAGSIVLGTLWAVAPTDTYAQDALGAGNVGLTFIYIVDLLGTMPGSRFLAPLFFVALAFAGISSLIAMFELGTTNLTNFGMARKKAALLVGAGAFLFGIPSALSIDFLNNQDGVWGVGLLISGLLTALAVMKFGVDKARVGLNSSSDIRVGKLWNASVMLIPLLFVVLFGWWVFQSIQGNPDWWNPFQVWSAGTLVVQWAILFVIVYALNGYFTRNVESGPMTRPGETVDRAETVGGTTDGR